MIEPMRWTDRRFSFDSAVGWFPALLERLRGTPHRALGMVQAVDERVLSMRHEGRWSVKDHLGHLADLADLDDRRVEEFLVSTPQLSPADMTNQKTEKACHFQRPVQEVVRDLSVTRTALVDRLARLNHREVGLTSVHPRLGQPIRLIDWVYFVAEHDDHHLARARAVLLKVTKAHLTGRGGSGFGPG